MFEQLGRQFIPPEDFSTHAELEPGTVWARSTLYHLSCIVSDLAQIKTRSKSRDPGNHLPARIIFWSNVFRVHSSNSLARQRPRILSPRWCVPARSWQHRGPGYEYDLQPLQSNWPWPHHLAFPTYFETCAGQKYRLRLLSRDANTRKPDCSLCRSYTILTGCKETVADSWYPWSRFSFHAGNIHHGRNH